MVSTTQRVRQRTIAGLGAALLASLPFIDAAGAQQRGSVSIHMDRAVAQELSVREYYALVIGINDYVNLTKLETAIHDAQTVAELLQSDYGFEVTLQLNPTRHDILTELARLRGQLTESASLLIYYAGHGHLDEETDTGYWLPIDADSDNPANWIANRDITTQLKAMRAQHAMIVADSCYSATLTRDAGVDLAANLSRDQWLQRMASKKSRTAMTSGGVEPVADGGGNGHSVFAQAFIDALADNESILDGGSLFDRVKRPVVLNAEQTPSYSDIRMANHAGGDFLFVPRKLLGMSSDGTGSLTLTEVTEVRTELTLSRTRPVLPPSLGRTVPRGPAQPSWQESSSHNRARLVGGGRFTMGSRVGVGQANEAPAHPVRVASFYMQEHEVTHAEYRRFDAKHRFLPGTESKPVMGLTWEQARAYARWLGGDLPTEAQWEFAARGQEGRSYAWGNESPSCERANYSSCGNPIDVREVGARLDGATPEGILDLSGNAPEWCRDWFGLYPEDEVTDPEGPPSGTQKVLRGGSFGLGVDPLRGAARYAVDPEFGVGVGFRVVWTEPQRAALLELPDGDQLASN